MGTCVHFSRSLPSNSWWQTMVGWQVLSRPSAAEGGGRRPAFTGLATQPYSATEVDGWQHKLSRVSQNRAAVQTAPWFDHQTSDVARSHASSAGIGCHETAGGMTDAAAGVHRGARKRGGV